MASDYVYTINMTDNVTSVNIKESAENRDSYHHGNLRDALIRAGLAALNSGQSADDLSLRALAREAGVSATAVYRHFPDKAALFAALAGAGLDRLAELQAKASATNARAGGTARTIFAASGAAYVRFALAYPELFRLMWRLAPEGDLLTDPVGRSHRAMVMLREGIAEVLPPGISDSDQRAAALACWGLVHGLAMLALDRQITLDDADIDQIVGAHFDRTVPCA